MHAFSHIDTTRLDEVIPLLSASSRPIAGGTDLLPLIKEGVVQPQRLLNLKHIPELRDIRVDADGLWIGALATLDDLDRHPEVRRNYWALAEAAALAASPQLRNMATIGGNLLQETRCWYYRSNAPCWLKGDQNCPARDGRNDYHAIFEQSSCVAVHPSDPPTALLALQASLRIVGPQGERSVAIADFLRPPDAQRRSLHTLANNEIIIGLHVPKSAGRSIYLKAMDRAVWAYALASVAIAAELDNGQARNVRIVLGGVANVPLRATQAEQLIEGQQLSATAVHNAGQAAIADAQPLERNRYKLALVRNLVAQALRDLQGTS